MLFRSLLIVMVCILSWSVPYGHAKDAEDEMEDAAEEMAEDAEDDMEDAEDDAEDDEEDEREEDLEDELEDDLEDRLEEAEELEDDLEDRLEDMLEDHEDDDDDDREDDLDDDLEDRLEDDIEDMDMRTEERIERQTERLHQLWEIEAAADDLESFVVADQFIALLSENELQNALADGRSVISTESLDSLGGYLVTFDNTRDAKAYDADVNHVYQLDAIAAAQPQSVRSFASLTGAATPISSDAVIGMMDSTIDTGHACFEGVSITQKDFYPSGAEPAPEHGTAMASVITGHCGLLEGASLVNAAVFGRQPDGGLVLASARELIAGLNWLAGQGVTLINLSLSGPQNRVLDNVLATLNQRQVWLVASSGNDGAAAFPRYPAATQGVIAVTAVDQNLAIYPRAVRGDHLDFAAPGVGVLVAAPDNANRMTMQGMDGTSVAAAYASALLAVARSHNTSLNSLQKNASDLGEPGRDSVYGFGLIQADKK